MTRPTDRPGYPRDAWNGLPPNPERRGWHWLGFKGQHEQGREPWAWLWSDEDGVPGEFQWMTDDDGDPERMARQFTYLGPCYTQADLDAAVQAERDACADVAYGIYDDRMTVGEEETAQGAYDAAVSIQARGPTPALDAALAQARPQYRHRKRGTVYEIVAEGRLQLDGEHDMAEMVIYRDVKSGEVWTRRKAEFFDGRFDAIRSAAAGEEGK